VCGNPSAHRAGAKNGNLVDVFHEMRTPVIKNSIQLGSSKVNGQRDGQGSRLSKLWGGTSQTAARAHPL
jgi:hypothetical protein